MSRGNPQEPDRATPQPPVPAASQERQAVDAAAAHADAQPAADADPPAAGAAPKQPADPGTGAATEPEAPQVPAATGCGHVRGDWDYKTLPANVQLGRDCWLERRDSFARFRSERHPGLVLGDRVRVHTWTSFNIEPSGLVEVGEDCLLVGAVFMAADSIQLGRRVVISYDVTLADSDFHPLDPEQRRRDAIAIAPDGDRSQRPPYRSAPIVIEDDVWIGIGALILKGVRIGRGARIGAGAVISRDVAAGAAMEGNPARPRS